MSIQFLLILSYIFFSPIQFIFLIINSSFTTNIALSQTTYHRVDTILFTVLLWYLVYVNWKYISPRRFITIAGTYLIYIVLSLIIWNMACDEICPDIMLSKIISMIIMWLLIVLQLLLLVRKDKFKFHAYYGLIILILLVIFALFSIGLM